MSEVVIINVATQPASFQVMTLPELVDHIVNMLPNAGYISIARGISPLWYTICTEHLKAMFDANKTYGLFFSDVPAFRRVQCQLDVLVSGSMALAMFRPVDNRGNLTIQNSDMDLYVEGAKYNVLRAFLLSDGYLHVGEFHNHALPGQTLFASSVPDDSFEAVHRFAKGSRFLDIIRTIGTPLHCIFNFHSTVVMNFITWDRAYCMWPKATLLESRGLILRINNERTRRAVTKYEGRGFHMIRWRDETLSSLHDSLAPGLRWAGDVDCMVVALDTTNVLSRIDRKTGALIRIAHASTYQYDVNGFELDYFLVSGPSAMRDGSVWTVLSRYGSCLLDHKSLTHSYSVPRCFHLAVHRYINRLINANGAFWRYRTLLSIVDSCLRNLKEEQMSPKPVVLATPLNLYTHFTR